VDQQHPCYKAISLVNNIVYAKMFEIKKIQCRNYVYIYKPQCKENLLNLSVKCWNSAFNAQGSRLIIVVLHVRAVKNICSSSGGAEERWKTRWNSVYHQYWWKKLVLVPVILLCKIFIPSYTFDILLCRNWPFSPPNRGTLRITLIGNSFDCKANTTNE